MVPTDAFSLDPRDVEQTGKSTLLLHGSPIGRVPGSTIDAQFSCGGEGCLVLVSYDHVFSALETALFVDRSGRIADRLTLGHALAEGLISDIAPDGGDAVTFLFPMHERRRIQVARRTDRLGLRTRWLHLS